MIFAASVSAFAQNNGFTNQSYGTALKLRFKSPELDIDKGQIISNILVVKNQSNDTLEFYVSLNYPPFWKTLFNQDKLYKTAPNDSIFIPVRIIPSADMKGDTKYFINAYIEDKDHRQVASEYFFASTERISQWELFVNPGNRIYFKNNENDVSFKLGVLNTGNEKQDILLTANKAHGNIILMDSTGKPIDDYTTDLSLKQGHDTTFSYKLKYVDAERNFKTIDIENYNPANLSEEKRFSVYFHSEEPRREKYSNASRSARVDFVKLQNQNKVNPYGSDVLPLSAYLRVSNLMEDIVFSSLHLRGQKQFQNGGNLIYNTSLYFSSMDNYYGDNYARNIPWYIGYFDDTKNIQLGYVNGGAIGVQSSGKGVKGEVQFIPDNWVGAYYVRTPYFFNDTRLESYGAHYRYLGNNFTNLLQYAHSHHKYAKMITDVISTAPQVRIAKKHSVNFTLSLSNRYDYRYVDSTFTQQGYLVGAGYSSSFFENIWRFNIRGTYTSKGFGAYGYERFYANHRSNIKAAKNLELTLVNNYNQYNYDPKYYNYIPGIDKNYFLFNSLNFYSKKYLGEAQPGIFYDIRNHMGYNFHSRGLNLSFSNYDINQNLQTSLITTFGFTRIINETNSKEHFITKINSMIRYRNFSFTGFYNYGPLSPAMVQLKVLNDIIPQTFRTSFMHMYMFGNRHVVLQSRLSYMYTNVYNHHSLNVSPELFYFTNTGWRFSINPTFTFYSSRIRVNSYDLPSYVTETDYEFRRYSNDNFLINLGVKKDFGIPIPTTFEEYNNINFKAFYDMNGNRMQDNGEPGIENVVLQIGNNSVITRTDGSAEIINLEPGSFDWSASSLVDLKGWFPLIEDSLQLFKDEMVYIPFVKGVKVMGAVFVEQEIVNPAEEKKLDISGIKITASDGYSFQTLTGPDGSFEFYLPFGEYTITMDEKVLNGRFYLLKNNYKLDLDKGVENMYITFQVVERKRTIRLKKFNNDQNPDGDQ